MQCLEGQDERNAFFCSVLRKLNESKALFLVGGACLLERYTGIVRPTKDLDIYVQRADLKAIFEMLDAAGYQTELSFSHWLGKVYKGKHFVDVIFNSGNGLCQVDQEWFDHAVPGKILGAPVRFCAPEETIWSKAFLMERERYDGADLAHLLLASGKRMDWQRLLRHFGPHWRVLLSHLILFGYIYPTERHTIPEWVLGELLDRLRNETSEARSKNRLCRGTLLSRIQYLHDIEDGQYKDARLIPFGTLTAEEAIEWTAAALNENR